MSAHLGQHPPSSADIREKASSLRVSECLLGAAMPILSLVKAPLVFGDAAEFVVGERITCHIRLNVGLGSRTCLTSAKKTRIRPQWVRGRPAGYRPVVPVVYRRG